MKVIKSILFGIASSLLFASPAFAAIGHLNFENLPNGKIEASVDTHGWLVHPTKTNPYRFCHKRISSGYNWECVESSANKYTPITQFNHNELVDFTARCYCEFKTIFGTIYRWRNIRPSSHRAKWENGAPVLSTSITETFPKNTKYGRTDITKICPSTQMVYQLAYPSYASGQFVGLSRFNLLTWTDTVIHQSGWLPGNTPVTGTLNVNNYLKPENGGKFKPFQTYKVTYAVGPKWKSDDKFFYVAPCGEMSNDLRDLTAIKRKAVMQPF